MGEIKKYEMCQFDLDFINHVKNLRVTRGISQGDLSKLMGVASSFVGNVESITQRHKYSTRHITLLAKAFGFENISELMNFPTPFYDKLIVTVEQEINDDYKRILQSSIIDIQKLN